MPPPSTAGLDAVFPESVLFSTSKLPPPTMARPTPSPEPELPAIVELRITTVEGPRKYTPAPLANAVQPLMVVPVIVSEAATCCWYWPIAPPPNAPVTVEHRFTTQLLSVTRSSTKLTPLAPDE